RVVALHPGGQPLVRAAGPGYLENVPGQCRVRAVQVVTERGPGHGVPPVVPGQRGDPVTQPGDLQPVGQVEVRLGGLLDRAPDARGDVDDVERRVRGDHGRDPLG